MKVIVSRPDLSGALSRIHSIAPIKPALPVLSNVLIEAIDDQIVLTTTDLIVSMRIALNAKVEREGAILLPARRFSQLIRELTTTYLEIDTEGLEIAHIRSGTSHFKMAGMLKSEFPDFITLEQGRVFKIQNGILKDLFLKSSFAAARDDNRQILNGISFHYQNRKITFIGTDGKRLARVFADIGDEVEAPETPLEREAIIPLKAVEEIIGLLDVKDTVSTLTFLGDKAGIEVDNVLLTTKLLMGQYPDVNRVIPSKGEAPILLHREELMSLLRQLSLFTKDYASPVRFTFVSGEMHLTIANGEIGEGKACMPVNYGGAKFDIAFNPHYFIDILRHTKDELIELSVSDTYSPGLITDSTNAYFVLMPMRIDKLD